MESEKVSCYKEWLPLEKRQFGVLAVIAEQNGFEGNLSDLCRRLSLSPQTATRNSLREAIEELVAKGFCECTVTGRTYTVKIIPQENEIKIDPRAIDDLKNHRYSVESVAWQVVLKVYLWACQSNWENITTLWQIANDVGEKSDDIIGYAEKVLEHEFCAINKKPEKKKRADGEIRVIGHRIIAGAWWNYKGKE